MKKIKVMIVDDSALIRQIMSSSLGMAKDIEVVGVAVDPFDARDKIKKLQPDVITLDVEMPKMDGIAFLENLMRLRPMPVVMVSTLTTKSSDVTLKALELGAIDFIAKPSTDLKGNIDVFAREVQEKIRVAAGANVRSLKAPQEVIKQVFAPPPATTGAQSKFSHIVAIGASTGGTEAIKEVLMRLPADCPPIVITQHIPESFSISFAKRLDECCQMKVVQASQNQSITRGTAYIAPGNKHLTVVERGDAYFCKLDNRPKVNRHRPSVDVLFDSVHETFKPHAVIGVILTGMGADGAAGLKRLHDRGCFTVAQDETTSVVWGMPGSAVKLGAVDEVLPLGNIAEKLLKVPPRRKAGQLLA